MSRALVEAAWALSKNSTYNPQHEPQHGHYFNWLPNPTPIEIGSDGNAVEISDWLLEQGAESGSIRIKFDEIKSVDSLPLIWCFPRDKKDLVTLFKLTWGGKA